MEAILTFLATTNGTIIAIAGIGSAIIAIWKFGKKVVKNCFDKRLEDLTEAIKENQKAVKENQEINSNQINELTKAIQSQNEKIDKIFTSQEQRDKTDKHILRSLITQKYYEYIPNESIPLYERQCVVLLYQDYKALNGNTFVDALYDELMALPTDEKDF